ncbi:type II toxin-antitoxin system ParD family antitoxin [Sphaerospermopsis aphanizomenoides BCCUSP55]|uniref:ribbon-helix-helix domain-containing protein n=1 Tax=Sphaerospermopsis aphanizomenoides TaxID=459663 RepID=UPI001905DBA8|nr:type II toxin-antitoxin system ParD family antitoxin [Sphaerospermopsis aphanizomenoides]MBK1987194.1 type II toxin-antitoxin system ParD family antitoxin [Sphaerospermopsis aphanizomenoides BCCUSP55]
MNIELKPETQEMIKSHVDTGIYTDADEVIVKALQLLAEWEEDYKQWEEEVRKKVEISAEQLDRGEGIKLEIVVEQLREKLRQAKEEQR